MTPTEPLYIRMDHDPDHAPVVELPPQIQSFRRLFAAKLLTHIHDYNAYMKLIRAKKIQKLVARDANYDKVTDGRTAENWIFHNDDDRPATFVWICGLFDLDPDRARNKIAAQWRA